MDLDKIIDADKLPKNGVVVVTVKEITQDLIDSLQSMGQKLQPAISGKNISVFVLKNGDTLETKTPEQMEKYGWYKKNKDDIHVCLEKGTLVNSLVKEIKNGSNGAAKELAELLSSAVIDAIKKNESDISLK